MSESLQNFLYNSKLADKIKIDTNIIIHNDNKFTEDILNLKSLSIPKKDIIYNLEISGQIIGSGKIIKKRNKYYFKILNIY